MNKYNEINLRDYKFSFEDNKELIPGCTLEQNRITNNSIIRVKKKNNLIIEKENPYTKNQIFKLIEYLN